MKNFVTLLLILFCSYNYSQYSKKELKTIKKAEIKIINRGLDLNAVFVPYKEKYYSNYLQQWVDYSKYVDAWADTLFEAGLEVGEFYETSDSVNFKGRYQFEILFGAKTGQQSIRITDLENNNKMVASISWNLVNSYRKNSFIRQYLLEELIRLN